MAGKKDKRPMKMKDYIKDYEVFKGEHDYKRVEYKPENAIFINKYTISHLIKNLHAMTSGGTSAIENADFKLSKYNKAKGTLHVNGVEVPVEVVERLEKVWVNSFGQYTQK